MIVVKIYEGLGNQIFQYAFAKSLQLKTGQRVILDYTNQFDNLARKNRTKRKFLLNQFQTSLPLCSKSELVTWNFLKQENSVDAARYQLARYRIGRKKYYAESIDDVTNYKEELQYLRGEWYIKGWFQNEKYFSDIREILLEEFSLNNELNISSFLNEVLVNNNTVAVHFRRGDYKNGHFLSLNYYKKSVEYIEKKVVNPIYLVFSDDIKWVKEHLKIEGRVIFLNEEGQYCDFEELVLMSKCKHCIIANSTFSWWGAWLNRNENKIVVAPKPEAWFTNQKNILLPDWKTIR